VTILKIGNDYLNMAHLVHARFDDKGVTLKFAAPTPASVGASDWSVGLYSIGFKGQDAEAVRAFLELRPLPLRVEPSKGGGS
jgi:hypothetical protein